MPDDYQDILDRRTEIEAPPARASYRVLRRLVENPDNHFVVSFGGGSLHGLAGNCALAVLLQELELRPHVREVWGTSAGAVVGGCWASGAKGEELLALLEELKDTRALGIARRELLFKGVPRLIMKKELPEGFVRGDILRETVRKAARVERIEDCEIPFHVIACTDDGHGRKVVFREGSLADAAFASMSLPGVFLPLEDWGQEGYFDGGIVEKTPLPSVIEGHARSGRKENLVVLCTHFDGEARVAKPRGFLQRFISVISRMEDIAWTHQLEIARKAPGCKAIVLNPRMKYGTMFDFDSVSFNYLWARDRFKAQLSNAGIGRRLEAR